MDSTEKFRQDVHYEIEQHSNRLGLDTAITEVAKSTYDQFITQSNAYTRPKEMFAIAALYIGVRANDKPLTMKDLISDQSYDETMRVFRRMSKEVGIGVATQQPHIFVDDIHEKLSYPSDTIPEVAKQIIDQCPNSSSGKRPSAVAAGAYYLAGKMTGYHIKQQPISDVANVSKLTIRKRYQDMENELPDDFEVKATA